MREWEGKQSSTVEEKEAEKKRDKQTSPPIFMLMKYFILRSVL